MVAMVIGMWHSSAMGSFEVHNGSSLDDFLPEERLHEEVESAAIKRVLAWQFEQERSARTRPAGNGQGAEDQPVAA